MDEIPPVPTFEQAIDAASRIYDPDLGRFGSEDAVALARFVQSLAAPADVKGIASALASYYASNRRVAEHAIERSKGLDPASQIDSVAAAIDAHLFRVLNDFAARIGATLQGRPDDAEPVDETWLRTVASERPFGTEPRFDLGDITLYRTHRPSDPEHGTWKMHMRGYEARQSRCPTARGQVRALASALGIALKE